MKKTLKTHIAIFSLLAVTVAICGCQSSTSMSQTSSEVTQSLNAETSLNSAEINIKLDITEEEMPELTAHENGGGDELFAFYGIKEAGRLGAFQKEFEDLVKESCTEKEYEEYVSWSAENDNPVDNKDRPYNINEMPNLPNVVKKYSLDHDKVEAILKDYQKYYTKLAADSEEYKDMIYTDEEIEAIASGDTEKCFDLLSYTASIKKGDLIYTPVFIYNNTMDKLEEAGITAEEIAERAERFTEFNLTDEQMTAFQNKMLKYVALQAEKGNFSGTYNIPSAAIFSIPEKIGNATFVKSA